MALTKSDLQAIKHIFRDETKSLKHDVKDLKIGLVRIEKKLDKSFDYLDKNDLTLLTGLNKVENNLGFPATKI